MTGDQARRPHGRRDNGLHARAYLPLDDVDPRVGEHLLDVLYLAGIAAYLTPSLDTDAVTRAAWLPSHPVDRIWVDRARLVDARELLGAEAAAAGRDGTGRRTEDGAAAEPAAAAQHDGADRPAEELRASSGSSDAELAAAFAAIVAGYDQTFAEPVGRWSAAEDLDDAERDRLAEPDLGPGGDGPDVDGPDLDGPARPGAGPAGKPVVRPADADRGAPRTWTPAEEPPDDERFVPPPPPPLPHVSRGTAAALAIMLIGIVLFAFPELLGLTGELALAVPIGAIVAGVAILIWRMYDGPPVDDGPDDGAVV